MADKTWAELTREQRRRVRRLLLPQLRTQRWLLEGYRRVCNTSRASEAERYIHALRAALAALPEVPR